MVRDRVIDIFRRALAKGAAEGRWPDAVPAISVESPRDPKHGDFAVNAAMVLAKAAGKPPREVAQAIVDAVRAVDSAGEIATLEIAGGGGESWGRTRGGAGKKVIVEYVSANRTGPMHVGHGRNAVVGDGVQSLLRWAGFDVVREYYVNDFGAQVQTLARSVHLRYQELHGRTIAMPPKSYPGEYVKDVAAQLRAEFGDRFLDAPESDWLALFRDRAVAQVLELIRGDLAAKIGRASW